MGKFSFLMVCLVVALIFCVTMGIFAEVDADDEMCIPLGEIILEPPDTIEAKRSAVAFPHGVHFTYACQECHHAWDMESAIVGCTTSGCHDLTESPKKTDPKEEDLLYYKTAFHSNCIGCHKEIKVKNKAIETKIGHLPDNIPATGPTGCVECHPK
jgi:hypothetical protein